MELKPCPFCGEPIIPFIAENERWSNGLWFLEDTHKENCVFRFNELFGYFHFGRAEDGKPTKELIEFAAKWNRRTNDV